MSLTVTQRIGVMGGMFDPVHNGHLETARLLQELVGLDEVRMVPCASPVHRAAGQVSAEQRCEMVALAIEGRAGLFLDRRECDRSGPSWTYHTLQSLRSEFPRASISVMMGLDAFITLPTWYRWQELFELGHLLVATRPEVMLDMQALPGQLQEQVERRITHSPEPLRTSPGGRLLLAQITTPAISSTAVRMNIRTGQSLTGMLPEAVLGYINEQQLYR